MGVFHGCAIDWLGDSGPTRAMGGGRRAMGNGTTGDERWAMVVVSAGGGGGGGGWLVVDRHNDRTLQLTRSSKISAHCVTRQGFPSF